MSLYSSLTGTTLQERLKRQRSRLQSEYGNFGISKAEACRRIERETGLSISPSLYQKYEEEDEEKVMRTPRLENLPLIAKGLNCDVAYLMGEQPYPRKSDETKKTIAEQTKLSKKAVENLMSLDYKGKAVLSALMENDNFAELIDSISELNSTFKDSGKSSIQGMRLKDGTTDYLIRLTVLEEKAKAIIEAVIQDSLL